MQTTSKIIQVSDIIQWYNKSEITLSPKYQRNSVWNDKAKSYLIDTLIRGFPIPPIFIRQIIDIQTKTTFREVIDGQQRLRAIIEFVIDESFTISKTTNKDFGGIPFSDLPDPEKERILSYEILAVVVSSNDESVIYDMFARLNSNNIVLNRQELRNSKFWGEYKIFIYQTASKYRDFFIKHKIIADKDLSRMKDVEFITSLVIILSEGIIQESPKVLDDIYQKYDKTFPNQSEYELQLDRIFEVITSFFNYVQLDIEPFAKKNYFYTLFAVIHNQLFGIKDSNLKRIEIFSHQSIDANQHKFFMSLISFMRDLEEHMVNATDEAESLRYLSFSRNHISRTTNKPERISRISFLNEYISNYSI